MTGFTMNGIHWEIQFVKSDSPQLVDRTGVICVATTDPETCCVYLSNELRGSFFARVLIHELGHCAMFSYGLIDEIRTMVKPEHQVEMEEFICNFLADYGMGIFEIARPLVGESALELIPKELERFIA